MIHNSAIEPLAAALKRLRTRFEDILNEVVSRGPVALLDFPNHPNVGDSAIWLGECAWLASRQDCPVVFVADDETFDIHALRRAMPVGTILLHGGGNFGDVWPACQALRERYLRELPEYRIVQLPQSIWFGDAQAAAKAAESARSHPDFTLLVRSAESYDVATREFGLRNAVMNTWLPNCPDITCVADPTHLAEAVRGITMQ